MKPETKSLGEIARQIREDCIPGIYGRDNFDRGACEDILKCFRDAVLREQIGNLLLIKNILSCNGEQRAVHEAVKLIDQVLEGFNLEAQPIIGKQITKLPNGKRSSEGVSADLRANDAPSNTDSACRAGEVPAASTPLPQPDSGKELDQVYFENFYSDRKEHRPFNLTGNSTPEHIRGLLAVAAHVRATDTAPMEKMRMALDELLPLAIRWGRCAGVEEHPALAKCTSALAAVRERKV